MFLNYLKIAWKVLLRRKFFTFISLFGISFTLMVVTMVTATIEESVGSFTPEDEVGRMLFVHRVQVQDTALQSTSTSFPSYHFLQQYAKTLQTPEKVSITNNGGRVNLYKNDKKYELATRATDEVFWEIMNFTFVAGRPYHAEDVEMARKVVVINRFVAKTYFGTLDCLGEKIDIGQQSYQVIGIVESISATRRHSYGQVFTPVTLENDLDSRGALGGYLGIALARNSGDLDAIKAEFQQKLTHYQFPEDSEFSLIRAWASTALEQISEGFYRTDDYESGPGFFLTLVIGILILFMLLPALNLININITRIMERQSEIGVRKAFGANANNLVLQFVFENVLLTVIGGIIGILLSSILIYTINESGIYTRDFTLSLNLKIFFYTILASLFFGVLSGALPALKMSRLPVVQALKGDNR